MSLCSERHPRRCKYFFEYQRCKFGDFCMYSHDSMGCTAPLKMEMKALATKVGDLEKEIMNMKTCVSAIQSQFTAASLMTSTAIMETNTDNKIASLEKLTEWLKLRSEVSDEEAFIYSQAVDTLEEKVFTIEKFFENTCRTFKTLSAPSYLRILDPPPP